MSDGYTMKDHVRDLEKWREEDMATITTLREQLAEAKADNARLREALAHIADEADKGGGSWEGNQARQALNPTEASK